MARNENTIFWIIAIAIVIFVIIPKLQILQKPEIVSIVPQYYSEGVEVFPAPGFSIVRGTYDEIAFNIYGSEIKGNLISDLQIINASPIIFKNALPTTTQTLNAFETDKLLWVSNRIPTAQFESYPQPVEFWVQISGGGEITTSSTFLTIEACTSNSTFECYDDDVYWYNSCNVREEKKKACGSFGCSEGICNTPDPIPDIFDITIFPSSNPSVTDTVIICAEVISDSEISIVRINLRSEIPLWNWGLIMDKVSESKYCKSLSPLSMKSYENKTISYYIYSRNVLGEITKTDTFYYTYY